MRTFAITLLTTSALALVSVQGAAAADLRRPMPVKAAPPVPVIYNWTGFYIGGNVGWGWTDGDGDITIAGVPGTFSGSGDGFIGGVQAGYNWQNGPWVAGIELDFQGSGGDGTITGFAGGNTLTASVDNPWFGTIRGRLGVAQDRWLWYVTGGALYGKTEFDGVVSGFGPFSSSESFWTWTIGAGVEVALADRWSVKFEYLYAGTPSDVPSTPNSIITDGSSDTHILRTGLNYRF